MSYSYTKSNSKEMSRFFQSKELEIRALIASEACSEDVDMALTCAVKSIQDNIVVSELPPALRRILNMWAKTEWYYSRYCDDPQYHPWYNQVGEAKIELCLRVIVAQESRRQLCESLKHIQRPDEEDVGLHLNYVCNNLVQNWPDMATKLTKEALRWIKKHDEHVMDNESEDFMWIHPDTGEKCYHLMHLPKPEVHDVEQALSSLETLPCGFQHEADWICPICLVVGEGTTCVRTKCNHVFHRSCLEDYNCAYLEQEDNVDKTCYPCPICRAVIN